MQRKSLILGSLLLAAFAINLDTTIVNVALPSLVRQLHASNSQLQWVVDAFNLLFAASVLAAGSLSDRFGRKGMLLAGLSVFGLASLAGGLTGDPTQLIIARSVMGLGAAMVFPSTLSMLTNVFTERERAGAGNRAVGRDHRGGDRPRADRRGLAASGVRLARDLLRDDADRRGGRPTRRPDTCRPRAIRARRGSIEGDSRSPSRQLRCSRTRSSRPRPTGGAACERWAGLR